MRPARSARNREREQPPGTRSGARPQTSHTRSGRARPVRSPPNPPAGGASRRRSSAPCETSAARPSSLPVTSDHATLRPGLIGSATESIAERSAAVARPHPPRGPRCSLRAATHRSPEPGLGCPPRAGCSPVASLRRDARAVSAASRLADRPTAPERDRPSQGRRHVRSPLPLPLPARAFRTLCARVYHSPHVHTPVIAPAGAATRLDELRTSSVHFPRLMPVCVSPHHSLLVIPCPGTPRPAPPSRIPRTANHVNWMKTAHLEHFIATQAPTPPVAAPVVRCLACSTDTWMSDRHSLA
jgi:hypothetical protein